MRSLICLAIAAAISALPKPGVAALSGFYDSAAQIQLLLESPALADALRQLPVASMAFDGLDGDGRHVWKITTTACGITARLIAVPPQGIGPTRYELAEIGSCD